MFITRLDALSCGYKYGYLVLLNHAHAQLTAGRFFLQLFYILCHYHLSLQSILSIYTSLGKAVIFCIMLANSVLQFFLSLQISSQLLLFFSILDFFYLFPQGCSSIYILSLSLFLLFFLLVFLDAFLYISCYALYSFQLQFQHMLFRVQEL